MRGRRSDQPSAVNSQAPDLQGNDRPCGSDFAMDEELREASRESEERLDILASSPKRPRRGSGGGCSYSSWVMYSSKWGINLRTMSSRASSNSRPKRPPTPMTLSSR